MFFILLITFSADCSFLFMYSMCGFQFNLMSKESYSICLGSFISCERNSLRFRSIQQSIYFKPLHFLQLVQLFRMPHLLFYMMLLRQFRQCIGHIIFSHSYLVADHFRSVPKIDPCEFLLIMGCKFEFFSLDVTTCVGFLGNHE